MADGLKCSEVSGMRLVLAENEIKEERCGTMEWWGSPFALMGIVKVLWMRSQGYCYHLPRSLVYEG